MDTLQIIAEPQRRKILRLIWDREMAAGDIADHFPVTFAAISQHLAVLRKADLVRTRRDGNRRLYRANPDTLAPFQKMLEAMWRDTLQSLTDAVESEEP